MPAPVDAFVVVGTDQRRGGMDYAVVPRYRVATMATAHGGSANRSHADTCAQLVVKTVRSNCEDDRDAASFDLQRYEVPMGERFSMRRLIGSMRLAGERLLDANVATDDRVTVCAASLLWSDTGVSIAWAGYGTRVHRISPAGIDLLTSTNLELADTANLDRKRKLMLLDAQGPVVAYDPSLGSHAPEIRVVEQAASSGDLFVLSSGWWLGHSQNAAGDGLLAELAARRTFATSIVAAALRDPVWTGALPCVVVQFP